MAIEQIVQNMIRGLGQSQPERPAPELKDHFVNVDERDPAAMLEFARRLAPLIRFYDTENKPAGDWAPFFRADEVDRVFQPGVADVPPHLALFGAFIDLYESSREVINRLTGEHLRFFYERVLGFERRLAQPDHAHVLVELKNNTPLARIGPEHRLTAGKGPEGERLYAPIGETIVRGAKVMSLRSIFVDGGRAIHMAPIANSADGLGGEWEAPPRNWSAFGSPNLPKASIGFAIASPVLRMAEGRRAVTCLLKLEQLDEAAVGAAGVAFDAYVTGAKGWIGPYRSTAAVEGNALSLGFTVPATEPPVVDYSAELHGLAYVAEGPVVQFHLRTADGNLPLDVLRGAIVRGARVRTSVSGVTSLALESDAGSLNPKKAFLPFGPAPVGGSRFVVGYPEALSKKLTELKIRVRWLGVPADFEAHYDGYDAGITSANQFQAFVSFHDGGSWEVRGSLMRLFGLSDLAEGWSEFSFNSNGTSTAPPPSRGRLVDSLRMETSLWARKAERQVFGISRHRLHFERFLDVRAASPREGSVTFTLQRDFLHPIFRQKATEKALLKNPIVLREPYTPTIQAIELDYAATTTEVDVSSTTLADFSNPDLQFFHIDVFGQRREHGYRRASVPFVSGSDVPLLPEHQHEGELLIGLDRVAARDTVSLLIQVAEATADPELPPARLEWSALCDNDWKPLRPEELVGDGSREFRRSGIVSLILPKETTTAHTVMPAGLTWIRAAAAEDTRAACRLVAVEANAIEVALTLADPRADAAHLSTALAPGSIAKLKTPLSGVKAVAQPYASFDGKPRESPAALHVRASERLRHKNRCVTPWDYERIVLEQFPSVHRVKCVPHARDGAWLVPGHVLLVVVPDLRNRTTESGDGPADPTEPVALDLLQPRVDIDTLQQIQEYVQERCGSQTVVHVRNPRYQTVRLDFQARFARGRDFHYHRGLLSNELVRFLSPWAFEGALGLSFGGRVFRSVLIDFIEELEYVDYLTGFNMFVESGGATIETAEAIPDRPDAILVSAAQHTITEAIDA